MVKTSPLLEIKNLSVSFKSAAPDGKNTQTKAVRGISLALEKGKILALVGESGSGKTVSALSILKLLPRRSADISGEILLGGEDLSQKPEIYLRHIRGRKVSMIFQEPMSSLNPLHTVEKQVAEAILLHQRIKSAKKLKIMVRELLELVGLNEIRNRLSAYPHQLSGGQRQRVMIAMALANNPDILIADEPTTALDVTVQAQILTLLKDLQKRLNMAVLLITHDLTIVEHMADSVAVMQNGRIVETGLVKKIFKTPKHAYTRKLLSSAPKGGAVGVKKSAKPLIETKNLNIRFPIKKGGFGLVKGYVEAVNDTSITIKKGHTLGVVGESGSGKTTLAMAILRLIKSQGGISFAGQEIHQLKQKEMRELRQKMQVVFQDPFASLNPRMTIEDAIEEGLAAHNLIKSEKQKNELIDRALKDVGLSPAVKTRYPHEFSGGQRQRICIARALVLNPEFIVLDEPTSALDLSTQAEILDLLKNLQKNKGLAYLFISHDLRVVKAISHEIIVIKDGRIIESGTTSSVLKSPKTPYTKSLLKAAFALKAVS